MNLTKLALKRPVSLLMGVLCVFVLGFTSLIETPLELLPPMEMPMFSVSTGYSSASPEDVEELVTKRVEGALATISGIKNISSSSSEGYSNVTLEFNYGTDMDQTSMDIQKKLDQVKRSLPDDASYPVARRFSADTSMVSMISVNSNIYDNLGKYVKDELVPEFEKISGVSEVNYSGDKYKYIQVALKDEKLEQYGLSVDSISNLVSQTDINIPAGNVSRAGQKILLRGQVKYNSLEMLRSMPITLKTGDVITLEDVSDIAIKTDKMESVSRINGEEAISIYVNKMQDANTVDTSNAVRKAVDTIQSNNPDINISVIQDQGKYITSSVGNVITNLILGAIISMFVLWFFLGDIKASLIVATSMPISIITTFALMHFAGINLNIISMGGLVIGIGMIVDNSIVILESMYRKRTEGLTFIEAAKEGVKIVSSAVIASTATTIVVFLPISVLKGLTGQIFKQIGFTVIFSLLASLISALTIIPALFYKIKPVEKVKGISFTIISKVSHAYSKLIRKVLRHKKITITIAIVLLVGSICLIPSIGVELMPQMDEGEIDISITGKTGLEVEKLDKYLLQVEDSIKDIKDVDRYTADGSTGGSGGVTIYLKKDREMETQEVAKLVREKTNNIVGVDVDVMQSSAGGGGGSQIQLEFQGRNLEDLKQTSKIVEKIMRKNSSIVSVSSSLSSGSPEAQIKVDPLKAASYGLTPSSVMRGVSSVLSGKDSADMSIDGEDYNVKIEFPDKQYDNVSDLSTIKLQSPTGVTVPLMDVADIVFANGPSSLQRKNNQYLVSVRGLVVDENAYNVQLKVQQQLKQTGIPAGVEMASGGQNAQMNEEFSAILQALALSILLVFMIMAGQFESMSFSLIVMTTVPFSVIGALFSLFITGQTLSMVSMFGAIILVGVVINNSIVLIDYAGKLQEQEGLPVREALIRAGETRLRPILMSSLTTILAMLPMAIGMGEGSEMMQSMAVIIMGGLLGALFITLLLIPVVYESSVIKKEKRKVKKQIRRDKKEMKLQRKIEKKQTKKLK